jgi:hypothetical protein
MIRARSEGTKRSAAALLATVSALALLAAAPRAAAQDCAGQAAPPADLATPSMLYETLSARTNAQLLAIGFLRKPVEQRCAWVYEVRMLTASGSVVELDFNARGLDIVGARGPENDRDAVDLVETLGGDTDVLTIGDTHDSRRDGSGAAAGGGPDSGKGEDGGEGSEGGSSGSGGGGSSGSGGGGGDDGGGEGGEGSGGEGGGGEGGGEGGDGGGDGGDGGDGGEGGDD